MAIGADFEANPALVGRSGLERISARAMDLNRSVTGVYSWLWHLLKTFPAILLVYLGFDWMAIGCRPR